MLVEVRPLQRKSWHGKEEKENFKQPQSIEVLFDPSTGKYATGLTSEEAEKYGKLLGADLSDTFKAEPHPYWSTQAARIQLPNRTQIFDDTKPSEFVKIKNLKASKFVANSMKEWELGLWPEANFVIFDEAEEVSRAATKIQKKNQCVKISLGMSADEKINIVQIISDKSLRGRSQDFLDVEIDKIIENHPADFLKYAKMDKQEVYTRATILEAIRRNVLVRENTAIFYMGERIGNDYEDAVQWFLDPQNSKMKVSILEKLSV